MIDSEDVYIVNYCHPYCQPFSNICRLPREEAFALACKMAENNPDTTAFGRFADFENYYPRRMKTDACLYRLFVSLGGKPKEKHPLSFVLHGSEFLNKWFGYGVASKLRLKDIPPESVSFTLGDSMAIFQSNDKGTVERNGEATMYTKERMVNILNAYDGTMDDFMREVREKHNYIEAQLWCDDCCGERPNNG